MATYRAISTVSQTIAHLLEDAYRSEGFKGTPIAFTVCNAADIAGPPENSVTLLLYRVVPETRSRTRPERGRPAAPLSIEAHYLLTSWGRDASQEQRILGWAMKALNDQPILTAAMLNAVTPNVFEDEETVELAPSEMSVEEMARIWPSLMAGPYRLSVAYTARGIRIS